MNEVLMSAAVNGEGPKMERMKPWKRALTVLAPMVLAGVLAAVLNVMAWGMPVWGAPSPKDVESVNVAAAGKPGDTYTDPENIELAVKLINYLNYQPFTPVSENSLEVGPDVSITYRLKDGGELSAAANWVTGWWNGEAHALKEPDAFVKLAKGIFRLDD